MTDIILASASPRRQELLRQAGIDFRVISSKCDESYPPTLTPEQVVMGLSGRKADSVFDEIISQESFGGRTAVIGADTVVVFEGRIMGKPKDEENAFNMLKALSGNRHQVFTGVTILYANSGKITMDSFLTETIVNFYPLSDKEIRAYIACGEPMDKAGGYGIQGKGALLAESISGDYFNVVGLPVAKVYRSLRSNGFIAAAQT